MSSVNTEYNILNTFLFNTSNINLVVNRNQSYNVPAKGVPSMKSFVESLAKIAPRNYRMDNTLSIVVFNNQIVKLCGAIPNPKKIHEKGEVYNCIIPYGDIDLKVLNQVITEIKTYEKGVKTDEKATKTNEK